MTIAKNPAVRCLLAVVCAALACDPGEGGGPDGGAATDPATDAEGGTLEADPDEGDETGEGGATGATDGGGPGTDAGSSADPDISDGAATTDGADTDDSESTDDDDNDDDGGSRSGSDSGASETGDVEPTGWCGDDVVDPGEACDDGNGSNLDACLTSCVVASCGDGFAQGGVEACDDGNGSNLDACLVGCVPASCGDGLVWAGVEICDDGNLDNGDGCNSACKSPGAVVWIRSFNGVDDLNDSGDAIATDDVGNVLVAGDEGYQAGIATWWGQIWVRKYTAAGAVQWTRTHNPGAGSHQAYGIAADPVGNVIVVGTVWLPPGQSNLWIRKYDPNGAELWTLQELGPAPLSVATDAAGNIVVAGFNGLGGGSNQDIWVRKLGPNGGELWTSTVDGPAGGSDRAQAVAIDGAGDIVVGGYIAVAGEQSNLWARKYGAAGGVQWTHTPTSTTDYDEVSGIAVDAAGNVVVGGRQGSASWLRKLNAAGAELWTQSGGAPPIEGVAVDSDGNIVLTSDQWTSGANEDDVWVRKLDPAGAVQWTETWAGSDGLDDHGLAVTTDPLDAVLVTGYEGTDADGLDVWVGKLAP